MMVGLQPVTFRFYSLYTFAHRRVVPRLQHASVRRGLLPHTSTNLTTYPYSLRMGEQTSRLLRFLAVVIIIYVAHPLDTLTFILATRQRRQEAIDLRI